MNQDLERAVKFLQRYGRSGVLLPQDLLQIKDLTKREAEVFYDAFQRKYPTTLADACGRLGGLKGSKPALNPP